MSNGIDPDEGELVYASEKPNVAELISEYKRCSPVSNGFNRLTQNEDVRFARWEGQTADGKKHDREGRGGKAFPWEGASDTQIHLANSIIDENVAIMVVAFFRSVLRAAGADTEDQELGANLTKLLDWILKTKQFEELVTEVELSAQYIQTYGICVLHPTWVREIAAEMKRFTMQQVEEFCAKAPEGSLLASFPQLIMDKETEKQAAEIAQFAFTQLVRAQLQPEFVEGSVPDELAKYKVSLKRARAFVKGLREEGEGEIALPYVCKNGPSITALKLWDEVFLPAWATDAQKCWVFRREFITEVELRARAKMEEWDPAWVEEAVKQKGKQSSFARAMGNATDSEVGWEFAWLDGDITNHDLIEVVHGFMRQIDEDGVPAVYWTVFHANISDYSGETPSLRAGSPRYPSLCAKHGLLDYAHNQVPFVVGTRERFGRSIFASRGVPQVVETRQREMKVQRDGLIDWTSIGVTPPVNVYDLGMKTNYRCGPATQNTVRMGYEPKFMDVPSKGTPVSLEVISLIRNEVANDFGQLSNEVPLTLTQLKQQMMVNLFLRMWQGAFAQEFKLVEQFTTDQKYQRITGSDKPLPKGEDIGQQAGLILYFDVRELDMEHVLAEYKVITQGILPVDSTGVIDRTKLVTAMLRAVNPALAKELVMPQQGASQQLFQKVQNDLLLMFAGNEPQYSEDADPTAGMKMRFAQQILQSNPKYQRAIGSPQLGVAPGDQDFAARLEKYQKSLQFNVDQEANKVTGRIGVQAESGPK